MEFKVQSPFSNLWQLLRHCHQVRKQSCVPNSTKKKIGTKQQDDFIEYLLKGPVYNDKDIQIKEENQKKHIRMADKN